MFDRSSKPLFYSYRIITDQARQCTLVCERDCTQDDFDEEEVFLPTLTADFILYCPNCRWTFMMSLRMHWLVASYTQLSVDLARLRILSVNHFNMLNFTCLNLESLEQKSIRLHRYLPLDAPVCSIKSNAVRPYHDQVLLQCEPFFSRSEILLWTVTELSQIARTLRQIIAVF